MNIAPYHTATDSGITISRDQASAFAKGVAGDFNPIHDIDAKRFCVPGDLLFAILLTRFGVSEHMHVEFSAMLGADTLVPMPEQPSAVTVLKDEKEKAYVTMTVSGDLYKDTPVVSDLAEQYVMFSGKTFPDILVELMKSQNVMINPDRPLVIYKDMRLQLDSLGNGALSLTFDDASLSVTGKKGEATLRFTISQNGVVIGRGQKNMLLSGLREYDEPAMQAIIDQYNEWKAAY